MSTNASAAAAPTTAPAPLPPTTRRADALSPAQRRVIVAAIVAAHGAAAYGLMQLGAVREAVAEAAPMFVDWIAPPAAPTPPAPPPPPQPRPRPTRAPTPAPVIAAAPSPGPPPFAVPEAPPPAPTIVETPAPVVAAPPAPPVPPAPPKTIPASAVQYLVPPALEYPRLSRRNNESGRVLVRVYIDTDGLPRSVQVSRSSGFPRLDEAALSAVQKARFKPYTENGQPMPGWALIPLDFNLEK